MNKIIFIFPLFLNIICCNSVQNQKTNTTIENSIGNFEGKLEVGKWTYKDKENNVIKSGFFDEGSRIGKWKYLIGGASKEIDWKLYNSPNFSISLSYPNSWASVHQKDKAFFALPNDDEYVVVLSFMDGKIDQVKNIDDYSGLVYQQMVDDSIHVFSKYNLKKAIFDNKKSCITGELYTNEEEQEFVYLVFYTQTPSDEIIDITYKTNKDNLELKTKIFNDFVYTVFHKKERLFYKNDYLISTLPVYFE